MGASVPFGPADKPLPIGTDTDRLLRDNRTLLELLSLGAVAAILVGVQLLADTDIGSSWAAGLAGMASQLGTTLPAAILVLLSSALQLGAGAVVIRFLRQAPYPGLSDALLGGLLGAVVIGLVALMVLGSAHLFLQPVLIGLNALLVGAGWFARPIFASPPSWRPDWRVAGVGLVALAWSGAVILQFASPVVPFMDVLPNHVAPAEHLRTFGAFDVLTTAPSPIYGPSRMFLGYTGLLGSTTVITGLPAVLAVAAFILPGAILVGVGMVRLASGVHGVGTGWWMLLAFTLTESFARLADVRATVLVLPLVAVCLVELLNEEDRRPMLLAVALGATLYLHPLVGVLTAAVMAAMVALVPARFARVGAPALLGGAILAIPQAMTMVAIDIPSALALLAVPPALGAVWLLDRSEVARRVLVIVVQALAIATTAAVILLSLPSWEEWINTFIDFFTKYPVLLWTVAAGGVVAGRKTFALAPVVAFVMGLLAVLATAAIPWDSVGIQGLSFEVSKTLHYWTPVFAAVMGAYALRAIWEDARFGTALRVGMVGIFLLAATLPIRTEPVDLTYLGEHRMSETVSIHLREAEYGFWLGYPDSRTIIVPVQEELVDTLRDEVAAGRLVSTTPVLHVAFTFQQWSATPIGVFGGMLETDVTQETEVSSHTAGGRLHPLDELDALLAEDFPYVVFEPGGLPEGIRDQIVAAGYESLFVNGVGEIFVAPGTGSG